MKKSTKVLAALMLTVMLMVSTYSLAVLAYKPAAPPEPAYDNRPPDLGDTPPTVDGNPVEWNLAEGGTGDFFADMIRAGGQGGQTEVESKLYLRYDCHTGTLYALVLGAPLDGSRVPVLVKGADLTKPAGHPDRDIGRDNAFIKIPELGLPGDKLVDGAGDGVADAEFKWINEGNSTIGDFDGQIADGWEASAPLAEGSYDLNVHTQVWHGGESQTSAVKGRNIDLVITCEKTPIKLDSFTAKTGRGQVTLTWEMGTEVDNAGFNLYRAMLKDGPYTQINEALIAAQGDAVAGASYSFLDAPDYGTFYYKLEDVDYYGVSTLHGPVKVTVARPLRRPLYRPRLPEF